MKLYAFWKYDVFPYILGGHITRISSNGSVETKEYGPGNYFKPFKIVPAKTGEKLHIEIKKSEKDFRLAEEKFKEFWNKQGKFLYDLIEGAK